MEESKDSPKALAGVVDIFLETGSEGAQWYFFEDGYIGYEAMREIGNGDHLKIFGENGEVLFDGVIRKDEKTGWQPYPYEANLRRKRPLGQQCALGFWIHWVQNGWQPDDWARLFIRGKTDGGLDAPSLRSELIKNARRKKK